MRLNRDRAAMGPGTALADRQSVAALEFALIAPILLTISLASLDLSRALLVWQQVNDAAEAVVENAEKMSVTTDMSGHVVSELTPAQIQAAMSTVYAQMPGIFVDRPNSPFGDVFSGSFAVTLSSVAFSPLCNPNATPTTPACTLANVQPQSPVTVWSSYLIRGKGDSRINLDTTPNLNNPLLRPCGANAMTAKAQFPNTVPAQFTIMIDPTKKPGAPKMILVPQLVADVQYNFTPLFSLVFGNVTIPFVASAALPAPVGQTNSYVDLNGTGADNLVYCGAPS
jgi:Flp pilus assembly protein TadG